MNETELSERAKRILVINPGPLFPVVMASQNRVVEMIKRLSKDHSVSLATLIKNHKEIDETNFHLEKFIESFYPVWAINSNIITRFLTALSYWLQYPVLGLSKRYFYWGNPIIINRIKRIISKNNFDIVQIEHWYQATLFNKLNSKIIKVISSHDILFEKKELELKQKYGGNLPVFKRKEFEKYKKQEIKFYNSTKIMISISQADHRKIMVLAPQSDLITIPMGKDIAPELTRYNPESRTILFYGSLSGTQNKIAFSRFWERIFPLVRITVPGIKVIVAGANPPESIKRLHDGKEIIVTGYVKDLTQVFQHVTVMIVPLETAGGFRGRVIDVMSYGIPVIGTHNALDCIEIENGKQGFISDDDNELALRLTEILTNPALAQFMSEECIKFILDNYSVEATYGKLSKYYLTL